MEQQRRPLIAVVDDDLWICRAIKRLAKPWGIETATFTSGWDFISKLDATPALKPDCAILDIDMPGMNGFDVQRHLVSRESRIPVIFITGSEDPGIRESALAQGAVAVFQKPFPIDLFIMSLHAFLK
jgi:FixJ family two-component response regulator